MLPRSYVDLGRGEAISEKMKRVDCYRGAVQSSPGGPRVVVGRVCKSEVLSWAGLGCRQMTGSPSCKKLGAVSVVLWQGLSAWSQ